MSGKGTFGQLACRSTVIHFYPFGHMVMVEGQVQQIVVFYDVPVLLGKTE